jgi:hypothetical protein
MPIKMKNINKVIFAILMVSISPHAKRALPVEPAPVLIDGQIISAPIFTKINGNVVSGQYLISKKTGSKTINWKKQIYETKYNPTVEKDVQDEFIQDFKLCGNKTICVTTNFYRKIIVYIGNDILQSETSNQNDHEDVDLFTFEYCDFRNTSKMVLNYNEKRYRFDSSGDAVDSVKYDYVDTLKILSLDSSLLYKSTPDTILTNSYRYVCGDMGYRFESVYINNKQYIVNPCGSGYNVVVINYKKRIIAVFNNEFGSVIERQFENAKNNKWHNRQ